MSENIMPKAWNEPGGGDQNKNPWGNRGAQGNGPPDLEQVIKNINKKLKKFFSGDGGSGDGQGGGDAPFDKKNAKKLTGVVVAGIAVLYGFAGFFTVTSYEQGVVTRFGAYERTVPAGLHWIPSFVESVEKVNTENIKSSRNSGWMLTKDENIIFVEIEVQYRVRDAEQYLFNVAQPDGVLSQVADSALRQVVGDSLTDEVLTDRKQQIAEDIKDQIIEILDSYNAGFHIEGVNFKDSRPPEPVKDAFDDVTKSREDKERLKLQAEAYANRLIPEAEGAARRILEEAEAYKQQVVLKSTGEAQRFDLIVPGYKKAPGVTQSRMYLEAIEEVLSKTTKILISGDAGNNMIYLPLDKMLEKHAEPKSLLPFKGVSSE